MNLGWALALRAIRNRPVGAILNGIAVALGIAVVLGVAITITGLDTVSRSAAQAAAGSSGLDVRVTAGTGIAAEDAARLGTLPGVADAAPLYEKRVVARLTSADVAGTTVTVLAVRNGTVAQRQLSLSSGRLPSATSHSEVVVDQGLASVLAVRDHRASLSLNDAIQLTTLNGPDSFTIVGFSNGGGAAGFTRNGVYITQTAMLDQFRLGLRTALVALRLSDGASSGTVADEVHATLGQGVSTVDPRSGTSSALGEVQPLLSLVTVLSLLIGGGVTANAVALAASERRRETGLLRAAGASSRQVFRLFMVEVALVTALAIPVGIVVGILLAALLEAHLTPVDLPVPALDVSLVQVVLATLAGAGAALVGGAIPALGTGRHTILSGLRPHPGSERERVGTLPLAISPLALAVGGLLFLSGSTTAAAFGTVIVMLGVVFALPLLAPWAARFIGLVAGLFSAKSGAATRNLVRRRNRTALTLSGLTISVASAFAVSALASGAVAGGDTWVTQLFSGDVVVRSPVAQTDAVAATIARSPGVRSALPLRFISVASNDNVLAVTTIDTASYQSTGGLDITAPARADALRAIGNGPAVLAPAAFAAGHGWLVGSSVQLTTGRGAVPFIVAGIVDHSFPSGNGSESLVMDRAQAVHYFGSSASGFDDLDVTTTGGTSAIVGTAAQFGLSAVTVDDMRASTERALQHVLGLIIAVSIVALVMSMVAVANTLLVNIRQGTRELSMMRAVGLDRGGARQLILTEAAVLAASGAVLGVLTGCAVVAGMLRAVATPGFTPTFIFPVATAVVVVATVIVGSVVATAIPAIRVSRSSIVASIRQE